MSIEEAKRLHSKQLMSPNLKKRKDELDMDLEKQRYENEYTTCCSKTGKQMQG